MNNTGPLYLKMVAQMGDDLPHAGDGPLLHLLVEVSGFESSESALVQLEGVGGEVKRRGLP